MASSGPVHNKIKEGIVDLRLTELLQPAPGCSFLALLDFIVGM